MAKIKAELAQYRVNLGRGRDYIIRVTPNNVEVLNGYPESEAVTFPPSPTFIRKWAEKVVECLWDATKVEEELQEAIDWWETEGMRGVN